MSTETKSKKPSEDEVVIEEEVKKEKDYSQQTAQQIKLSKELVETGGYSKLKEAIDGLLSLEKQARVGGDGESTGKIVVEIVRLCAQVGAWKELNENVAIIAKKRNQIKGAIAKMVQEAMTFLDKTPSKGVKIELIDALRSVSEGKIYVEVERSRLVRMLAKIKEDEGNIKEAADLLQEVQIETVGSMEAKEKIDFILEQMRLVLDKKDFVRAQIISKKITARSLADPEHQELKIRYHLLMIRYFSHKKDYLEICKAWKEIFDTPKVQEDIKTWTEALENMVIFVLLAPYDNHQSDLMHRIWKEKKLEEKPLQAHRELLKIFVSGELILWFDFEQKYSKGLQQLKAFAEDPSRWADFKKRVVENNIRIIAKFYNRITTKRLSELLCLDPSSTEEFVSKMVVSKTISAKIDRLEGVITFKQAQEATEVLNGWSADIVQLLSIVEKSVHLINGQMMQYGTQAKAKGKQ